MTQDYRKRAESIIVHKSDCANLNDGVIDIGLCICNYELRVDNLIQDFKEIAQEAKRYAIDECAQIALEAEKINYLMHNDLEYPKYVGVKIAKAIGALSQKDSHDPKHIHCSCVHNALEEKE